MKKFLSIILALLCVAGVFSLCACDSDKPKKNIGEGETNIQIGEGDDALSVDESTIKSLLAAYPQKALGMKKEIYDYELSLTADKFKEVDAIKVEAFLDDAEKPEKTFMFLGNQFYIYDEKSKEYLLLTVNGPVANKKETEDTTKKVLTNEEVEEENNNVLQNRYAKYDLSGVKLPKPISEYDLLVTGTPATAADKSSVYVIKVMEKDGTDTGIRFAVGEKGDYYFNTEKNTYVRLK